ncbi:MAG: GAF domain-containing protein, partial [Chloroflexota bacterium]
MSEHSQELVRQLETRIKELTQSLANTNDQLQNLTSQLETIHQEDQRILDVSRQLSELVSLPEVYSILTKNIIASGIERCTIRRCSHLDADNIPQTCQTVFIEDVNPARKGAGLDEYLTIADYPALYRAARSQTTVKINDLKAKDGVTSAERVYWQRFGTRSLVIIPLIVRRHVIRLVTLESRQPQNFSRQAVQMYQILCNQATIAIENVRQVERTATALAGVQSLYRAGRILAGTATLKATFEEALLEFLYSLNLDQGGITLISPDREYGQLMAYCQNYELQDTKNLNFPINEAIPYQQT